MVQEKKQDRYRGVLCSFCRQPIPLPLVVARLNSQTGVAGDRAFDGAERCYHIRCRVCEKEACYRSSEAIEVEGAPRPRSFRWRSEAADFLRGHGDVAKAANG
jgi:hypothetical protein